MKKALLAMVVLAGTGYGVYRWRSEPAPAPKHQGTLVADRLWLDHIPRNDRDTIQVFLVLTEDPIGAFQAASAWKGAYEIFKYESHGDEYRMVFPQNGSRDNVTVKATSCNRGGMDYCLELDGASRGVKQYYSRKGWEIGSLKDVERLTKQLAQ